MIRVAVVSIVIVAAVTFTRVATVPVVALAAGRRAIVGRSTGDVSPGLIVHGRWHGSVRSLAVGSVVTPVTAAGRPTVGLSVAVTVAVAVASSAVSCFSLWRVPHGRAPRAGFCAVTRRRRLVPVAVRWGEELRLKSRTRWRRRQRVCRGLGQLGEPVRRHHSLCWRCARGACRRRSSGTSSCTGDAQAAAAAASTTTGSSRVSLSKAGDTEAAAGDTRGRWSSSGSGRSSTTWPRGVA